MREEGGMSRAEDEGEDEWDEYGRRSSDCKKQRVTYPLSPTRENEEEKEKKEKWVTSSPRPPFQSSSFLSLSLQAAQALRTQRTGRRSGISSNRSISRPLRLFRFLLHRFICLSRPNASSTVPHSRSTSTTPSPTPYSPIAVRPNLFVFLRSTATILVVPSP
jgi:hypothetical protein